MPFSPRDLPLRHVLAIAMTGLTALAVTVAVVLAHHEVRRSAEMAAAQRIERVTDQLSRLVATSAEQRRLQLLEAGRDPVLTAALTGRPTDADEVRSVLGGLRGPNDAGLPVQLWDLHGGPVFSDPHEAVRPMAEGRLEPRVPLETEPAYGSFHTRDGQTRYYSTAPVWAGETQVGWIVQERQLGNPQTAAEIQRLIGSNARVLVSFARDSLWITLAGEAVPAPVTDVPADTAVVVTDAAGARFLVQGRAVAGTPWSVLVEVPEATVYAAPRAFVQRMAAVGLVLVLAAMVLAWLLSRRLTGPLRELASASDALASGELARRVAEPRGEEVGRVATAFNAMADRVATSHRELEARLAEARALAAELERAKVAAESADRTKSEFLATMSHEIRTPINAVLGLCEVMALDGQSPEKRGDYLRRTQRAARQLANLVDDVLDLMKAESGGIRIDAGTHAVESSVGNVAELLADEASRRGLDLALDVEPGLTYHADAQRVEQILLNLLGNAVKFTPAGGRVAVTGSAGPDGTVRIGVADTGIGIAPDELDRIFEPFVQAQTGYTREYGGTGLGLSISRRLARLMGGDVLAESGPGSGSRFTLVVPAASPGRSTPEAAGHQPAEQRSPI